MSDVLEKFDRKLCILQWMLAGNIVLLLIILVALARIPVILAGGQP